MHHPQQKEQQHPYYVPPLQPQKQLLKGTIIRILLLPTHQIYSYNHPHPNYNCFVPNLCPCKGESGVVCRMHHRLLLPTVVKTVLPTDSEAISNMVINTNIIIPSLLRVQILLLLHIQYWYTWKTSCLTPSSSTTTISRLGLETLEQRASKQKPKSQNPSQLPLAPTFLLHPRWITKTQRKKRMMMILRTNTTANRRSWVLLSFIQPHSVFPISASVTI